MLYLSSGTGEEAARPLIDSSTVAIVVAVIALLGVLAGQIINMLSESRKRRDSQTAAVRTEVQTLMMAFYNWAEFARSTYTGKFDQKQVELFEEEWVKVSPPLAATAALMAGRGSHRDIVLVLIDGISIQSTALSEGENVGVNLRSGYVQMGWAAFDTVGAWLRGERVPRHARRTARQVRRMRKRLDEEYAWRERRADPGQKMGIIRYAWRQTRFWLRRQWMKIVAKPAKTAWDFLFAP